MSLVVTSATVENEICKMLRKKVEVIFGEVIGMVSDIRSGMTRERVVTLVSMWLLQCAAEQNECHPVLCGLQ